MKNKKVLIIIGVAALLVVGGVGGFLAFNSGKGRNSSNSTQEYAETAGKAYDEAKEKNVTEADDPYDTKVDFEGLQATNEDVYAWIRIPGTNIDYPILQNAEEADDYYLNRTMDGQTGLPGSIYTEKYNTTGFTDPVTVIYGHTLHDGTMFSELKKYKDKEFFDENRDVYIQLPGGRKKYQIFAAVAFDDRYLMGNYAFTYDEDFNKYISELKACMEGNVDESIDVKFGDKIITLSTCIDEYPDQRWLVNAVLVDEEWY